MKPSVKIASIVAAVLITTGIVIGIASFSIFGIDRDRIAEQIGYEKEIKEFASNSIDNIKVDLWDRNVSIEHSNTNKIEVEYYSDTNAKTTLSQNGSTLSLENRDDFEIFNFSTLLDFFKRNNTDIKDVIIRVPIDYAGDFNIETSNGSITAREYDKVRDMLLKTINGKIEASDIAAKSFITQTSNSSITLTNISSQTDVSAQSTNGRIEASDIAAKSFITQTSNSSITLRNISSQTDVSAQSRNGKIDFDNVVSHNNLNASTTNSSVRLVNSSSKKITATSTNGSVEVDRITGFDITMKATNSRITGTIIGKQSDYSIKSKTSNSTSNLPSDSDGSTGGELVAQTSNGRIEIKFID